MGSVYHTIMVKAHKCTCDKDKGEATEKLITLITVISSGLTWLGIGAILVLSVWAYEAIMAFFHKRLEVLMYEMPVTGTVPVVLCTMAFIDRVLRVDRPESVSKKRFLFIFCQCLVILWLPLYIYFVLRTKKVCAKESLVFRACLDTELRHPWKTVSATRAHLEFTFFVLFGVRCAWWWLGFWLSHK